MIATIASAVAAAVAVIVWFVPARSVRARVTAASRGASTRRLRPVVLLAPLGVALVIPMVVHGVLGLGMAALVGLAVARWQNSSSSRSEQTATTRRVLALPVALDVLSACLTVGASHEQGLRAVASGVRGSLGDDLRTVAGGMRAGADVTESWSLVDSADLQPLAAIMARADATGAPITPLLALLADQHRHRARAAALDSARALGVRVAGPLGLCFLPAFILIAVVPLVVALLPFRV